MSRPPSPATSVPRSLRLTYVLGVVNMVVATVIALVTWLRYDDILMAWAERKVGARRDYLEGGLEALRHSHTVPDFMPLAVTAVGVFVPLLIVLLLFLRERVFWARPALTVTAAFTALLAVEGMFRDLPTPFLLITLVAMATLAAFLVALWWPSTGDYLTRESVAEPLAEEPVSFG